MVRVDCSRFNGYFLHYEEYKNKKGEVIFNTLPPYKQFKVYVIPNEKYLHTD